ncbi:aminotransferase class I/II-fold pyridoxal phosphate-dependent enzyme [Paralimibaculum aggregatum]|uniref:aspartate transaminase n=1 Tax=Paralimibaculum aggregatum TaxID=3036245 RepID=A0ABQ6LS46_9RHOB|nr:aminotransferase class I/II-fold pyridoxal phosphate-dependent enzyme [Limibaculum sp. NKW23]GMG84445.1 aminotransferase class I/II-fold pyridoxal phosphate-dependent enzyme [Limibaculum sp. NKW23]
MTPSKRSDIPPFYALDVFKEALAAEAAGRDVIHMEVGEPAFGAPASARRRIAEALAGDSTLGYTSGLGLPALREAIAGLYQRRHGLVIDPGRIIVTTGSSAGFQLAFLSLFDAGQRVAIADPSYPAYRNILSVLGLRLVRIEAELESRYQPTPALLAEAGPLEGLLIASPANPAGTVLDRAALGALVEHCAGAGVTIIADEIYHGLTYGPAAPSVLEFTDEAVVINSFSKYFTMTGWRIGWMVVPERMVRPMERLAQNLYISANHASQIGGIGALEPEGEAEAASHMQEYATNRQALMAALPALGFSDIAPCDGGFYVYAGLGGLSADSRVFCAGLLRHEGVATTPGLDFDPVRGTGTLRLSFAQSPERIAEGIRRIRAYVEAGCPV